MEEGFSLSPVARKSNITTQHCQACTYTCTLMALKTHFEHLQAHEIY